MADFLPPLVFGLLVISLPLLMLWLNRRRAEVMAVFAAAHGLAYAEKQWPVGVPYPDVPTSWFLGIQNTHSMIHGFYRGVYVVAFDFKVDVGRSRQLGSGVGIKGKVTPERLQVLDKLDYQWAEPWSFLSTRLRLFGWSRRLRTIEILQLWDTMIDRARLSSESFRKPSVVSGGLHIRPRKISKQ